MPEVNFLVKKGLTVPKGSASTPAVIFDASDSNTGLYSPGADQVAISTSGVGRLLVDASGNVGVGVTPSVFSVGKAIEIGQTGNVLFGATSSQLNLMQNASYNADFKYVNTAAASYYQQLSGAHIWHTAASGTAGNTISFSERMRITSAGLVGIGTSLPSDILHINKVSTAATVAYLSNTGGEARIGVENNSGTGILSGAGAYDTVIRTAASTGISFGIGYTAPAVRIDSSGRLLVGTSTGYSPWGSLVQSAGTENQFAALGFSATAGIGPRLAFTRSKSGTIGTNTLVANGDNLGDIIFAGANTGSYSTAAIIRAEVDGTPSASPARCPGRLVFSTTADGASSPTERMRITSDGRAVFGGLTTTTGNTLSNIIVGTSGTISGSVGIEGVTSLTTLRYHAVFSNGNGRVGSISTDGTATAYTTSSDYRLKENATPVTDGITRLQQLKPSRFNFIADPDTVVDGFIAHEVQDVVPEAITGDKDAVDEDGNPIYQGIDQSKLVPLLTAALQEAIAKIETLEARLTAAGIE